MLQRLTDALAAARPVTPDDLLTRYKAEMTVTDRHNGYSNPRVTRLIDGLAETEVTHVVQTPLKDLGYIVVQAAAAGGDGAIPFQRRDSGNTGWIDLRAALQAFDLKPRAGRKLRLPVQGLTMEVEGKRTPVLLIRVKRQKRKTVQRRATAPAEPETGGHRAGQVIPIGTT